MAIQNKTLKENIKGWSKNVEAELKETKNYFLVGIDDLDKLTKNQLLST
jgi:hypothetical protein